MSIASELAKLVNVFREWPHEDKTNVFKFSWSSDPSETPVLLSAPCTPSEFYDALRNGKTNYRCDVHMEDPYLVDAKGYGTCVVFSEGMALMSANITIVGGSAVSATFIVAVSEGADEFSIMIEPVS